MEAIMTALATTISNDALDHRARRAARRVGLEARKSRWRAGTVDNQGGFMLRDPSSNIPLGGFQYDMTAEDVIAYCEED
jgi:hypothetical protein